MHLAQPDGAALGPDPDADNNGRVSAREAYDYADSVHHPHDTPNYSQSSSLGGRCSLGVTGAGWIWPILYLYVERWWKRPWPEAFQRLEKIQPELGRLVEAELGRREHVRGELEEMVKQALGAGPED
jgi:hypothetical protein